MQKTPLELSRASFFSSTQTATFSSISWILLLMFGRLASATLALNFKFEGTEYTASTDIDNHAKGVYAPQLLHILPDIKENLLNGSCGNITLLENSNATRLIPLWSDDICGEEFLFARVYNNTVQALFENCTIDTILNPIRKKQQDWCEHDSNAAIIALVVVGVIFCIGMTILVAKCSQACNDLSEECFKSNRRNYEPINSP